MGILNLNSILYHCIQKTILKNVVSQSIFTISLFHGMFFDIVIKLFMLVLVLR